jgi:ribonuclease PH
MRIAARNRDISKNDSTGQKKGPRARRLRAHCPNPCPQPSALTPTQLLPVHHRGDAEDAALTRTPREVSKGRASGRTHEIQRLIGRSLRAVTDLSRLGERTVWIDCDVIQADGGTRTASVTGAFVALGLALEKLVEAGTLTSVPLRDFIAAVSIGIVDGEILLDLCYEEDSRADVDMNFVMTAGRKLVEVQATAERQPFDQQQLDKMLALAAQGAHSLIAKQQAILRTLTLRQ